MGKIFNDFMGGNSTRLILGGVFNFVSKRTIRLAPSLDPRFLKAQYDEAKLTPERSGWLWAMPSSVMRIWLFGGAFIAAMSSLFVFAIAPVVSFVWLRWYAGQQDQRLSISTFVGAARSYVWGEKRVALLTLVAVEVALSILATALQSNNGIGIGNGNIILPALVAFGVGIFVFISIHRMLKVAVEQTFVVPDDSGQVLAASICAAVNIKPEEFNDLFLPEADGGFTLAGDIPQRVLTWDMDAKIRRNALALLPAFELVTASANGIRFAPISAAEQQARDLTNQSAGAITGRTTGGFDSHFDEGDFE